MNTKHYVRKSLELHLFFGRIMKEHSFFLHAGFTPANPEFSAKSGFYQREFHQLLRRAIRLGRGIVSPEVLRSGELVTEYTERAEQQSAQFTGIPIDRTLTAEELQLKKGDCICGISQEQIRQVQTLNRTALRLLDGLIAFKEAVLQEVLRCNMFTMNYPLLIEHIIREAKLYRQYIRMLEESGELTGQSMKEIECFWNQIMMEHALFIRGLLDPSESELIHTADSFAHDYSELLETCRHAHQKTMPGDALTKTKQFREFKTAGVKGIASCQIRSVILPLLADHVLREANHYIRLLQC